MSPPSAVAAAEKLVVVSVKAIVVTARLVVVTAESPLSEALL